MKSPLLLSALLLVVSFLVFGCSSDEARQLKEANLGLDMPDDAFALEAVLCRKVGRKSGRRIGVGDEFKTAKKSSVMAFVDFDNVKQDRTYTVHLAWIRPDGREMFRKFAEVNQVAQNDQFQTVIRWLNAEDLHKVKADTLLSDEPEFTLQTKFNISDKRQRTPGLYHFRVYLDRALTLEQPFTVIGPEILPEVES